MNSKRKQIPKIRKESSFIKVFNKILPGGKIEERLLVKLSLVLIFIISITYFYWYGEGLFFFQENKSLFIFSNEYLEKFIIKPGGLLEYSGNFLTQFYFNSLYGSLINSTFLILVFIVLIKINRELAAGSISLFLVLVPSCLLLFIQILFINSLYNSLGYLLLVLWFYFSIVSERKWYRFIILALFPLFFFIAGSIALVFPLMYIIYCIIFEKGIHRYLQPAFLIVIVLVTFILFKEILFLQSGDQLLRYPIPFIEFSRLPALYNILLGYIVLFPLLVKLSGSLKVNMKYAGLINIAALLTVFTITVFLISKNYDRDLANFFKIEKSVYKQDWDSIIRQQESAPSKNINCQYYYNLALSEKGQLCSRLFFGRQDFSTKSLILPRDYDHINRAVYFYYSIGLVSEAHRLVYESMVLNGYRPENIKLLIKTELINGNYKIAELYINVLKKTLHYRNQAEKYEKMIQDPVLINSDPELAEKIRSLPKRDFFIRPNDFQNIELILMADPSNKRAFEYKLARMLFEKDLKAIVNEVKKIKGMGYEQIPRHIEEAIVLFIYLTHEFPDLGGLTIRPETELHFSQYLSVYNNNSRNKQILEREILKAGGKTFWYYHQFK